MQTFLGWGDLSRKGRAPSLRAEENLPNSDWENSNANMIESWKQICIRREGEEKGALCARWKSSLHHKDEVIYFKIFMSRLETTRSIYICYHANTGICSISSEKQRKDYIARLLLVVSAHGLWHRLIKYKLCIYRLRWVVVDFSFWCHHCLQEIRLFLPFVHDGFPVLLVCAFGRFFSLLFWPI